MIYVAVACRTSTSASALRENAGNAVIQRDIHHALAHLTEMVLLPPICMREHNLYVSFHRKFLLLFMSCCRDAGEQISD